MTESAALETQEQDQSAGIQAVIDDCSVLVSPPDVCLKITDMLVANDASADQFAEVILRDPSLTAKLLKLVNSSYYGLPSQVDTISRALTIIGTTELTNLVYSLCAVQSFSKLSSSVTNMNTFWRHGVYMGLLAKQIAIGLNCLRPERLFVAGLLHDIGALALNRAYPDVAERTIVASEGDESMLARAENEHLGFDHAYLGALMLAEWHLPETTCEAIRWHHDPRSAENAQFEAAILNVADTIANASGTGGFSETVRENDQPVDLSVLDAFGAASDLDFDQLIDTVDELFIDTIYLIVT